MTQVLPMPIIGMVITTKPEKMPQQSSTCTADVVIGTGFENTIRNGKQSRLQQKAAADLMAGGCFILKRFLCFT